MCWGSVLLGSLKKINATDPKPHSFFEGLVGGLVGWLGGWALLLAVRDCPMHCCITNAFLGWLLIAGGWALILAVRDCPFITNAFWQS